MSQNRTQGFSLIELVIVVVIVAILMAVALPAYQSQTQKTRRADAKVTLSRLVAAQERWYFINSKYSDTIADIGSATSDDTHYTISLTDNNAATGCTTANNCFLLTATAASGGNQYGDTNCRTFTMDNTGVKVAKNSGGTVNTKCW